MPFVQGYLRIRGLHPDQGLPEGEGPDTDWGVTPPLDPGFGGGRPSLPDPGFGIPQPPPGVWPPPSSTLPIVPAPPGTPPGAIWPPIGNPPIWSGGVVPPARPDQGLPPSPGHPDQGLPPSPGHPDQGLPPSPGHPDQGLPPSPGHPDQGLPSKTFWVVCGIPGVGWRYVAVDPSLHPAHPMDPVATPK